MWIKCCKDCTPPRRHAGCHSDCIDYILEKSFYLVEKESQDEKRYLKNAIYEQRDKRVRQAQRHKRN